MGRFPMFRSEHGNGVGWAFLDFSTPYLDYLCAQTEEAMERYPDADGIFMDISFQYPSISTSARTKMDALGIDWTNAEDRAKFTELSVDNYFRASATRCASTTPRCRCSSTRATCGAASASTTPTTTPISRSRACRPPAGATSISRSAPAISMRSASRSSA